MNLAHATARTHAPARDAGPPSHARQFADFVVFAAACGWAALMPLAMRISDRFDGVATPTAHA